MFKGLKNGWDVLDASLVAFFKYPILLCPLLFVWTIYAPIIVYFKWHFDWSNYNLNQTLIIVFLIIFSFSLLLTISCSILLELIQQIETGKKFSIKNYIKDTFTKNIFPILILSLVWATIWFLIVLLEAIFRKKKSIFDDEEKDAENIAKTLAGVDDFSLSGLTFKAIKKGIRMIVFLIMPAIAWENLGIKNSFSRGFKILRNRVAEFISGYALTYLASAIIFFPPGLMFFMSGKMNMSFPEWAWIACIIYIAFAWSYTIYLEQMFTAELYLWHLKWEREVENAIIEGKKPPKFSEIKRPSILDDIPDLICDAGKTVINTA